MGGLCGRYQRVETGIEMDWPMAVTPLSTLMALVAGWFFGKSKRKQEKETADLAATKADEAVFRLQGHQIAWLTGEVKRLQGEVVDLRQQQLEQSELIRVREVAHSQEVHQLHIAFEREKQQLITEKARMATAHLAEVTELKLALEAAQKGIG